MVQDVPEAKDIELNGHVAVEVEERDDVQDSGVVNMPMTQIVQPRDDVLVEEEEEKVDA